MPGSIRPLSAPAGGDVAVCPHCWGVNPGGERLCGRCGADMTLLLQESGGLRRTPAVQSPVPVSVAGRLGPLSRALLLLFAIVLTAAWLIAPLLGSAGVWARNSSTRRPEDTTTRRAGRPHALSETRLPHPEASVAPERSRTTNASSRHRVAASAGRRSRRGGATVTGRF